MVPSDQASSPCASCADVIERHDVPHVIRTCASCGREMHIYEPGAHGRGLVVRPGDRPTIPAGFLKLSLNPLKSSGHLTKAGIHMLAQTFFLSGLPRQEDGYLEFAANVEKEMDAIAAAFLTEKGFDLNDASHSDRISSLMQEDQTTKEYWAFSAGLFLNLAREAVAQGDARRAAWAAAYAERLRSMVVFKESLEEVVWMAYSARRLIDVLQIWDGHSQNSDEEFWQLTFNENSYVLSQVFAVPMLFIKEKAYVGGMTLERTDSRFVDYLYSAESSREAILVEIKSPTTPLLGISYRGHPAPSKDLSGSVVQVLNYRSELSRNLLGLTDKTDIRLNTFSPKCALIIGNGAQELADPAARRSFELFRTSLKDVEIITYDELFRKVEILAELFRLKRSVAKPA
jgi:Domain of unknown function (DUF4263)